LAHHVTAVSETADKSMASWQKQSPHDFFILSNFHPATHNSGFPTL